MSYIYANKYANNKATQYSILRRNKQDQSSLGQNSAIGSKYLGKRILNVLPHLPVWILRWVRRLLGSLKALLQKSHLCGFIPICPMKWTWSLEGDIKAWGHIEHFHFLSLLCPDPGVLLCPWLGKWLWRWLLRWTLNSA